MFRVMIRGYSMLLFFSKPSLRASASHQAPQGFVLLMDRVINDTTAKPDFWAGKHLSWSLVPRAL